MNLLKKSYETARELEQNLDMDSFLLSENISESNKFIKLSNELFEIGFIYYDLGLVPQIEIVTLSSNVFLGVNRTFVCLDYINKRVLFEEKLPSLLHEILIDSNSKYIVLVCELDVIVYRDEGVLLWRMGFQDIIEDYYLEGEKLNVVESESGDKSTFYLESGEVR